MRGVRRLKENLHHARITHRSHEPNLTGLCCICNTNLSTPGPRFTGRIEEWGIPNENTLPNPHPPPRGGEGEKWAFWDNLCRCPELTSGAPTRRSSRQPPATILTISSRSPALRMRWGNSEGATASPLCSTTTLRGRSFCATRNASTEHGNFASIVFPLAMTQILFTKTNGQIRCTCRSKSIPSCLRNECQRHDPGHSRAPIKRLRGPGVF